MTLPDADERLLRRYLLGTISDQSREDLEARLLSDDQIFWERVTIAEDELVSDYVQGALSADERLQFENAFLCTDERRAKVEFMKALRTFATTPQPVHKPRLATSWWQRPLLSPGWALAAAALLILLIQVPRMMFNRALPADTGIVAVTLPAGLTRAVGGELPRVRVTRGTRLVRLQLDPGSTPYSAYRASVHNVDGGNVLAEVELRSSAADQPLTLTLPAESLTEGDYYVRLHGVTPGSEPVTLNRYDFRVLRE
jgi:hypothetical protein